MLSLENTEGKQRRSKAISGIFFRKHQSVNFEEYSPEQLAEVLSHFYLDVRTKYGNLNRATSLENFRHSLIGI